MTIGSILSPKILTDGGDSILGHGFQIAAFLRGCSRKIDRWMIFYPNGAEPILDYFLRIPEVRCYPVLELLDYTGYIKFDVWHDFGFSAPALLCDLRKQLGRDVPLSLDFGNLSFSWQEPDIYLPLQRSDVVVFPSACIRDTFFCFLGGKGQKPHRKVGFQHRLIPAATVTRETTALSRDDSRSALGFSHSQILLVAGMPFSGSYEADILPLLVAFRDIRQSHPHVHLAIFGPDPENKARSFNALPPDLLEAVTLLGNPCSEAIPLLFRSADIFINIADSFRNHGVVTSLLAAAVGVPVVASRLAFSNRDDSNSIRAHSLEGAAGYWHPLRGALSERSQNVLSAQAVAVDLSQLVAVLRRMLDEPRMLPQSTDRGSKAIAGISSHEERGKHFAALWREMASRRGASHASRWPVEVDFRFPVSSLKLSQILRVTAAGEKLIQTGEPMIPEELKDVLFPAIVIELLERFVKQRRVEDVISDLTPKKVRKSGGLRAGLSYHTGWCLKHGYLEIVAK